MAWLVYPLIMSSNEKRMFEQITYCREVENVWKKGYFEGALKQDLKFSCDDEGCILVSMRMN